MSASLPAAARTLTGELERNIQMLSAELKPDEQSDFSA
jgi:hypothetical protein